MRSGGSRGRITVSPSGASFASTVVIAMKSRGCLRGRECPRAGRGGRRNGLTSAKASPPRRLTLAVARPSSVCERQEQGAEQRTSRPRLPRSPDVTSLPGRVGARTDTRTGKMEEGSVRSPVPTTGTQVIRQVELQPADPLGPLDWLRLLPHETAASSDRLGGGGLQAARRRAAPALALHPPPLTHHPPL